MLANKKDKKALAFWEEAGYYVGLGLVGFINVFNPEAIIIGGGVSNNLPYMKSSINKTINDRAMSIQSRKVKILRASLGDDAGVLGGQVLVSSK
jgi:glucokinase